MTSVTVRPPSQTATRGGSTVYFTALANNSTDITNPTDGTTWTVKDSTGMDQTSNFYSSFVQGSGEGFTASQSLSAGAYTVTATYSGISGTATLNVN